MWQADPQRLSQKLSEHLGLLFTATCVKVPGGDWRLEFFPDGIHNNEGFILRFDLGWRSLTGSFIPGPFAATLLAEMRKTALSKQVTFRGLIDKAVQSRAEINLRVNGTTRLVSDLEEAGSEWRSFELTFHKSPLGINTEDHPENDRNLESWVFRFAGLVFSLLPLEASEAVALQNPERLPEGSRTVVQVNRYERSPINRANCIAMQGDSCKACGFNFASIYGPVGAGFIHVHHVIPVSQLGEGYVIDPAIDLVPLCPNCHAMAHKADPPFTVEQLRGILQDGSRPRAS
jgi:5-methylcytosine-specific restriction protein A